MDFNTGYMHILNYKQGCVCYRNIIQQTSWLMLRDSWLINATLLSAVMLAFRFFYFILFFSVLGLLGPFNKNLFKAVKKYFKGIPENSEWGLPSTLLQYFVSVFWSEIQLTVS